MLCFDRAGLVGEDGATHNGTFDLAAYRSIPNAVIAAPADECDLKQLMFSALQASRGPYIIRYPRGCGEGAPWKDAPLRGIPAGKGEKVREGERIAILVLGPYVNAALDAADKCAVEKGFTPAVYNLRFLKPLDEEILREVAGKFDKVITVEDGSLAGGLYGAVSEYFAPYSDRPAILGTGIPDRFITHASQQQQRAACKLDADGILAQIRKF